MQMRHIKAQTLNIHHLFKGNDIRKKNYKNITSARFRVKPLFVLDEYRGNKTIERNLSKIVGKQKYLSKITYEMSDYSQNEFHKILYRKGYVFYFNPIYFQNKHIKSISITSKVIYAVISYLIPPSFRAFKQLERIKISSGDVGKILNRLRCCNKLKNVGILDGHWFERPKKRSIIRSFLDTEYVCIPYNFYYNDICVIASSLSCVDIEKFNSFDKFSKKLKSVQYNMPQKPNIQYTKDDIPFIESIKLKYSRESELSSFNFSFSAFCSTNLTHHYFSRFVNLKQISLCFLNADEFPIIFWVEYFQIIQRPFENISLFFNNESIKKKFSSRLILEILKLNIQNFRISCKDVSEDCFENTFVKMIRQGCYIGITENIEIKITSPCLMKNIFSILKRFVCVKKLKIILSYNENQLIYADRDYMDVLVDVLKSKDVDSSGQILEFLTLEIYEDNCCKNRLDYDKILKLKKRFSKLAQYTRIEIHNKIIAERNGDLDSSFVDEKSVILSDSIDIFFELFYAKKTRFIL